MIIAGAAQQRSAVVSLPYFEMIVKTDNAGTSDNDQFTIPTTGGGYNYTVETSEQLLTGQTGNVTLDWASAGTHWVRITGDFPSIFFNNGGDRQKLLEVSNWGDILWGSFFRSFWGCDSLLITALDSPNLSSVTNMESAFWGASSFNQSINHWDISNVQNIGFMFRDASAFNQPLNNWNTSNVTSSSRMFRGASAFNQPLNNWDTSLILNMDEMFRGASAFNRDLSEWCVELIGSPPLRFDLGATSWVLPRPNWGDPC